MRTLALLLATSTLVIVSSAAAAPARRAAPAEIRLVVNSSQPRPGGGERVRYTVLQRVQPLLAVAAGDEVPATVLTSGDDVELSRELDQGDWLEVATLTVDRYGPQGPPVAGGTAATPGAASDASAAPAPLALAIAPVRPDPASGRALVVDVALPGAGPARLEVLDVMGRRIAVRELGALGGGRHTVDLSAGQRFAPGVYLLRLTQGGEARVGRVTVVD